MDTVRFGLFLSEERKAKGLTQKELAGKLGVTDKAVSKWERGICLPDVAKFADIAAALDLTDVEVLRAKRLPPETAPQSPPAIFGDTPPLVTWKEYGVLLSGCFAAAALFFPVQILEFTGVLKMIPLSSLCQCVFCAAFGVRYAWRRGGTDTQFGWRRVCDFLLILIVLGAACLFWLANLWMMWEFPARLLRIRYAPLQELLAQYGWSPFFLLYLFLCMSVFDVLPVGGLFACFAIFPAVKLLRIFRNRKNFR